MRLRTRSTGAQPAEPFDVPDRGGYVGLRRDGPALLCVLMLAAPPPSPVLLPDGPRARVPLDRIAACMTRRDARPTRVDVVTRTLSWWGDGPAARAYRGLLGPVPAASHRAVALRVRVDPALCPEAVALRGGGAVGALRAALWSVHRVRAAATAAGIATRALTAAELSTDGAWTLAEAPVAAVTEDGLVGHAPPLVGDGQLVGAGESGCPVALRVAGPDIDRVAVAADVRTVRQTALRSVAIGVRTHVTTDRPAEWSPMVAAVADPRLLSCGPQTPPTAQLLINDLGARARAAPGLTVVDVHRDDCDGIDDGYLLRQDRVERSLLHLVAPRRASTATVRQVTTPAERELTG